jgi:hypothetical protein
VRWPKEAKLTLRQRAIVDAWCAERDPERPLH